MLVTQLRRYQLAEGTLAEWVEHWQRNVLPLRLDYSFKVLFAYADHGNSQFVWALAFDGTAEELKQRDTEYHDSPQWAARNAGKNGSILSVTVGLVDTIVPPR